MPRTPYSQGHCANCGAHRLLKYAHRTMCARYKCQKAASAQRQARLAGGGADDAVVPTFCYKIEAVLGMRFFASVCENCPWSPDETVRTVWKGSGWCNGECGWSSADEVCVAAPTNEDR